MYTIVETDVSKHQLKSLLTLISRPYCLIGGWSVYLIVNDSYRADTGREYQGSRDIDLGFHFDPTWDTKEFANSPFAKTVAQIKKMGFEGQSYRFFKKFHATDGHALSVQEIRRLQPYDVFTLFIDLFVDSDNPKRIEMAKFPVAEELLLAEVFGGNGSTAKKLDGLDAIVPDPRIQMKMKMRSFPGRNEEDKKRKDLIDLCALISYSGFKPPAIEDKGDGLAAKTRYREALKTVSDVEWKKIAEDLDVTVPVAKRIANQIG